MEFNIYKFTPSERIEFWILTFLFALAIVDILPGEILYTQSQNFISVWVTFLGLLAKTVLIYFSFLIISIRVLPNFGRSNRILSNITITALIVGILFLAIGWNEEFVIIIILIVLYTLIKYFITYKVDLRSLRSKFPFITTGRIVSFALAVFLISILARNTDSHISSFIGVIILFAIILHIFSFQYLIPKSFPHEKPFQSYLRKSLIILILTTIPVGIIGLLLTKNPQIPVLIAGYNFFAQLFITVPISWWMFTNYLKEKEKLIALEKDLGQSRANIDLLRSQINPHFLFNALNTLYAAALNEGSYKTGEGIQKLGDMMRFLLHENTKDSIPIVQEIEYLENYIDLQRIRTDPNPKVSIKLNMEKPVRPLNIAPMLLIPFVENAFKHGVSFKNPSPIVIQIKFEKNFIFLEVKNKKQDKKDNDPERHKGGIGLLNVKQRLHLLYYGKHQLKIEETDQDFSIYLSVQLN